MKLRGRTLGCAISVALGTACHPNDGDGAVAEDGGPDASDTSPSATGSSATSIDSGASEESGSSSVGTSSTDTADSSGETSGADDEPFDELCARPDVLRCVSWDSGDLSEAQFNAPAGNEDDPHKPRSDTETFFEGGGALLNTVNGSNGADVSGYTGYDFPLVSSGFLYASVRIRFGDRMASKMRGLLADDPPFAGTSGMKFFQIVDGTASCSGEELVLAEFYQSGVPQMAYSCSGWPFRDGDDRQPDQMAGPGGCTGTYIADQIAAGQGRNNPPCVVFEDDRWHLLEVRLGAGSGGVKLWVDGAVMIDQAATENGIVPQGPFQRFYIGNYMTGYGGEQPGLYRIWYDNLIMSTSCITTCDG